MRVLMLLAMGLALTAAPPCWAAQAAPSQDVERRLALADRYLELSQGSGLAKTMRRMFEQEYAKSEIPADQQAWLVENMAATMEQVMRATNLEMREDVAELYTEAELEAAIAFMSSPLGRSVTDKSMELMQIQQEAMLPHAMTAFTKLGEKFCARFSCEDDLGFATKN